MHSVLYVNFFVSILTWWDPVGPTHPIIARDSQEYKIMKIMSHKKTISRLVYQVKWKGYATAEYSCLREEDLAYVLDLLQAYQLRHGTRLV